MIRVFKFGGASVKNAEAVKNVSDILSGFVEGKYVVVVSAMGKTTNNFELLVDAFFNQQKSTFDFLERIKTFHREILVGLFSDPSHRIYNDVHNLFVEIEWILEEDPQKNYAFIYDQIVGYGELLSSKIISTYLQYAGKSNCYLDARDCIITDNNYREGKVNWETSIERIHKNTSILFQNTDFIITQGFIGCTSENYTTTLGREGSDYTAAIFAYALNAKEVTIWKDVPGVLNADPKSFENPVLFNRLSYNEAIELTYYGASVIHPKTIKPLQNKGIPLLVRSFLSPAKPGTEISGDGHSEPIVPSFIFKKNQILISISAKDFSFIAEENLSLIFSVFAQLGIKVNLMQNSALSFSACFDSDPHKTAILFEKLSKVFRVLYNESLELLTIRHFNQKTIDELTLNKEVILEQKTRNTAQFVYKEKKVNL
jgi:aspartate kinase